MANDLSNIMPKILARGLLALRELAVMPRLVNGDYSSEAAQFGDTIDVPIPSAIAVGDVTPSNTPPTAVDNTPTKVQISLNKWKKAAFHLTDKQLIEVDRNAHFIPMETSEAVKAIANQVNSDIHAEYKGVYGYVGTAAVTPFATTVAAATDARKTLNKQLAPRDNRRGVLNFDAEANALALAQFSDAEKVGSSTVKIRGEIGEKYGIDWVADDGVTTHTAGTGTGYLVNNGAGYAAGIKTVTTDTGSGTVLAGDIITFAGHTQTYAVVSSVGGGTVTSITFEPGLAVAVADNVAITLKATHVVNLAFHRDAIAFANRPLVSAVGELELGSKIMSMTDPQTGLSLRLEISRQYKQTVWELDMLYGAKLVRAALATRIAG